MTSISKLSWVALTLAVQMATAADDIVGKQIAGFQGWFAVEQDSTDPMDAWFHWGNGTAQGVSFEIWPDTTEYSQTYQWDTNAKLGNGNPAVLYDATDQSTIDLQFSWMSQYGIDTAGLQRFGEDVYGTNPKLTERTNDVLQRVASSSEKYNVPFYVEWDISGWTDWYTELPEDWTNNVSV
jgi:hypothetical protein